MPPSVSTHVGLAGLRQPEMAFAWTPRTQSGTTQLEESTVGQNGPAENYSSVQKVQTPAWGLFQSGLRPTRSPPRPPPAAPSSQVTPGAGKGRRHGSQVSSLGNVRPGGEVPGVPASPAPGPGPRRCLPAPVPTPNTQCSSFNKYSTNTHLASAHPTLPQAPQQRLYMVIHPHRQKTPPSIAWECGTHAWPGFVRVCKGELVRAGKK